MAQSGLASFPSLTQRATAELVVLVLVFFDVAQLLV